MKMVRAPYMIAPIHWSVYSCIVASRTFFLQSQYKIELSQQKENESVF